MEYIADTKTTRSNADETILSEDKMDNHIRTVTFMGDQRGLCEDLYRDKETGRVYIRQECDDSHVRWLTASKWTGGYEADCHMRSGLVIRVADKAGNVLFEESLFERESAIGTWAQKNGSFSWEAIAALADEYKKKFGLSTYEEWRAWLMADAKPCKFEGCSDNWLFAMAVHGQLKKISQINFLGVTAYVTVQEEKHKICGKGWLCYEIKDVCLNSTLAICGYKFQSGG